MNKTTKLTQVDEDEQFSDLANHLGHFGIETNANELRELCEQ